MFRWSWLGMLVPFGGRAWHNIGCQWGNLTENEWRRNLKIIFHTSHFLGSFAVHLWGVQRLTTWPRFTWSSFSNMGIHCFSIGSIKKLMDCSSHLGLSQGELRHLQVHFMETSCKTDPVAGVSLPPGSQDQHGISSRWFQPYQKIFRY